MLRGQKSCSWQFLTKEAHDVCGALGGYKELGNRFRWLKLSGVLGWRWRAIAGTKKEEPNKTPTNSKELLEDQASNGKPCKTTWCQKELHPVECTRRVRVTRRSRRKVRHTRQREPTQKINTIMHQKSAKATSRSSENP